MEKQMGTTTELRVFGFRGFALIGSLGVFSCLMENQMKRKRNMQCKLRAHWHVHGLRGLRCKYGMKESTIWWFHRSYILRSSFPH